MPSGRVRGIVYVLLLIVPYIFIIAYFAISGSRSRSGGQSQRQREKLSTSEDYAQFEYPVAKADECGPVASRGNAVLKWIQLLGAQVHSDLAVTSVPNSKDERQVVARKAIANGTKLFVVPSNLHMSVKTIRTSPGKNMMLRDVYRYLDDTDIFQSSLFGLAFLLLHEAQNASSAWRPFMCSLPPRPATALLMSDDTIKALRQHLPASQSANFDHELQKQRKRARELEQALATYQKRFPAKSWFRAERYTLGKCKWALAIIASRAFSTSAHFEGKYSVPVHTIIPGIDMLNHDNEARMARELLSAQLVSGAMEIHAHRDLQPGAPAVASYGRLCDALFLAHYGFTPAKNDLVACPSSLF